ncbi:TOMM precursor leader peptide-binding protein [Streptomyces virginiae]|uniref:TOMM precursor leader peptide-binding protein n=1 Tax=Streptomyces virginiae TaxID=1961 RepID=UPI00131DD9D9|nr:TOMM precursor leader peptide-binding protein [Streptomyces virginiae]
MRDIDPESPSRAGSFWDQLVPDGDSAISALGQATVALLAIGDDPSTALAQTLETAGMRVVSHTEPHDLTIVVTDNYLSSHLADVGREQRTRKQPWLLTKTQGTMLWVGPVFEEEGCWDCLAHRLAGNYQCHEYLRRRPDAEAGSLMPAADLPLTVDLGERLVAIEAMSWLAGVRRNQPLSLLTFDIATMESERHSFVARPQCPACGDPGVVANAMDQPLSLQPRVKSLVAEAGHRAQSPDSFLEAYQHLVSPVTGVVPILAKVPGMPDLAKMYVAGSNLSRNSRSLHQLRAGLRCMNGGKGTTDIQAKASALGEGLERYSGRYQGDERRVRRTWEQVTGEAIHPHVLMQHSEAQYAGRSTWNAAHAGFQFVGHPFDESVAIDWSPVWSLTERRHKYLPTSYLYFDYPSVPNQLYSWGDSNGNAAGTSLEDAIIQGFFELIERDSVALWWYNRTRMPAIDLATFNDPWITELCSAYTSLNREVWALDLTADFGLPVVAAISRRTDKRVEDILFAFGAHFDLRIALTRALTELNQFLPVAAHVDASGSGYVCDDADQLHWLKTARLEDHPYLMANPQAPATKCGSYPDLSSSDLLGDVHRLQALTEERGMEMLVLNHTRPDIGLPVVKVIVPGLRHFWARFAPGRLYHVPVALGRLSRPTKEQDLNPYPMFV